MIGDVAIHDRYLGLREATHQVHFGRRHAGLRPRSGVGAAAVTTNLTADRSAAWRWRS
jgi:hypothetical protein